MTARHLMALRLLLGLADGILAFVVFLTVSAVRFTEGDPTAKWSVGVPVPVAATLFALTWVGVLWSMGLYRLTARWSLGAEARDIVRATVLAVALTLSALFIFHQDDVSRLFLAILFIIQPALTLGGRALLRSWFSTLRRRGLNTTYMLIAGTGKLAQRFADSVESRPALGIRVIGHLTVPSQDQHRRAPESNEWDSQPPVSRPILGSMDEMGAIFRTQIIDEVAVCLPPSSQSYLEPIIAMAADEGKTVRVPSDPDQEVLAFAVQEEFEGFVVRSIVHDTRRELELAIKRVLDCAGAAAALVVLSPVLLVTALTIRLKEGSPVLFRQTRVGLHGRTFTIYKFRTMVPNAEERYDEVADKSDTRGAAFKMHDDPRVTGLGRFLRRSSIDELPQLLNVLSGDMSLVGPRPAPPREVDRYDIWHRRRLSMRPGMTGLWQVSAALDEHFDERAELDLRYIDQWSLLMDLGILARTVPAIFARQGH
ncbi:MAG TPA: sugar transferase [Candidatus Dormibacteraeota bacterium]|jgi:exopolysaccharide biosynthesis polyprenyl glycosylphosphotransferase